jgi:hypothetical protein
VAEPDKSPYAAPRAPLGVEAPPDRGDVGHGMFIAFATAAASVLAYFAFRVLTSGAPEWFGSWSPWIGRMLLIGPVLAMGVRCLVRQKTLSAAGVLLFLVLLSPLFAAM